MQDILYRWLRIPYVLHVRFARKPKKPRATILFLHGIGHSGEVWRKTIDKAPDDVRVIVIDLLGFGDSSKPRKITYNAKTQARSVLITLAKQRIKGPVVIVGHSLGALVAIEVAKRYPLITKKLILCGPPFYKPDSSRKILPHADKLLTDMYRSIIRNPDRFVKLSRLAVKYRLAHKAFDVAADSIPSYMAALEAMIINQTSFDDAKRLRVPMSIVYGTLDPVVIGRNIKELTTTNKNASVKSILAGHEINSTYTAAIIAILQDHLSSPR